MKPCVTPANLWRSKGRRARYKWMHLGALLLALAVPAMAQADETIGSNAWWVGPIGAALVIAAAAWALLHLLRTRQRASGRPGDAPQVLSATALGARERAVVLRVGGRVFLLGVTAQQVSMLAELDANLVTAQDTPAEAARVEPDPA